jgi:peptide/nickel transport system substrate-binding protein/oligopeptide transport system substrate-binding protein
MKEKFLSGLLVIFLLLSVNCGEKEGSEKLKSLKFAIETAFKSNYHPVEDNLINFIPLVRTLFSTLFRLDAKMVPYPFLVDHYTQEGNLVTFYLKKGIKFSNGEPISAEDVVWSIEGSLKYALAPNQAYKIIQGGGDFYQGKSEKCSGIKVLTKNSFQIHFKYKNTNFGHYLALPNTSILPKNWTRKTMVFSGAFQLQKEEIAKNITVVTLKQNPYFIGKKPNIDKLDFYFFPNEKCFENSIKQATPDIFLHNFHFNIPQSDYEYGYFKTPIQGYFLFLLNPKNGVFAEKKLRRFFSQFILSLDLIETEKWKNVISSTHVLPYGLPGYFLFDPIITENFKKYAPKTKTSVRCFYTGGGIRRSLFPLLKEKLEPYNMNLELTEETWDILTPRMRRGDFDLTAFYYIVDIPHSFYFYEALFSGSHDINPMGYQVKQANNLIAQYREEEDEIIQLKILSQLEKIAQKESYLVPFVNQTALLGYKQHIKNVKMNGILDINFEEIDVEEEY